MYEYQVIKFISGILAVAGIDDEPTFTRSKLVNVNESIGAVLQASEYLSEDYVTEKVLNLLGDGEAAEDMLDELEEEELEGGDLLGEEDMMDEGLEEEGLEEGLEEEIPEEEGDTDMQSVIEMLEKLLGEM